MNSLLTDPELRVTSKGVIYRYRYREKDDDQFKLYTANLIDLVNVASYFSDKSDLTIEKWEIPALSYFIRKHIFKNHISRFKARELAITLKSLSKLRSVL